MYRFPNSFKYSFYSANEIFTWFDIKKKQRNIAHWFDLVDHVILSSFFHSGCCWYYCYFSRCRGGRRFTSLFMLDVAVQIQGNNILIEATTFSEMRVYYTRSQHTINAINALHRFIFVPMISSSSINIFGVRQSESSRMLNGARKISMYATSHSLSLTREFVYITEQKLRVLSAIEIASLNRMHWPDVCMWVSPSHEIFEQNCPLFISLYRRIVFYLISTNDEQLTLVCVDVAALKLDGCYCCWWWCTRKWY